jgi:hypothetical protein
MRKMFLLFGVLALVGVLFVACSDQQDLTSPEEAAFKGGKVENKCTGTPLLLLEEIEETIDVVLRDRQSKKGAHQIVDNIARKVCANPPQYMATYNMVNDFHALLAKQPQDELVGGWTAARELLALVTFFATDVELLDLPEETLTDGGFGVVTPGTAQTLFAISGEAALVVDGTSFPGATEPVVVYFYRTPDPVAGTPDFPIPGYQAYPEAWNFSGTAQPTGGVDFWMCVVTDPPAPPFDRLVIGHDLGEGSELLTPRLVEDHPGQVLDCGNAEYIDPPALASIDGPGWLMLAGSLLSRVVDRILDVEPLNASYFGGKGLGGRGTSFSDFAPVDAGIEHPVLAFDRSELNRQVGESTVNRYYVGVTNWEAYPTDLFVLTSEFGTCGDNPTPSRTWVEIYDASDDSYIYGFCGFDSPDDLIEFWFPTDPGQAPPDVYIELWDRDEGVRYRSNTITVPTTFNTLTVRGAGSGEGTLSRAPDIDCTYAAGASTGDCEHTAEEWVRYGTVVATPAAGSVFSGWSGACSGTGACDVNMDASKLVVATFTSEAIIGSTLTITITSDGGPGIATVVTDNHDNSCLIGESPCTWAYPTPETSVTITGTPEIASYTVISGACTTAVPPPLGENSCSFTAIAGAYLATVHFTTVN